MYAIAAETRANRPEVNLDYLARRDRASWKPQDGASPRRLRLAGLPQRRAARAAWKMRARWDASAAERQRECRARRACGLVTMPADVKLDRLVLALQEDKFLAEWDDQNPEAINRAFSEMRNGPVAMLGPDVTL